MKKILTKIAILTPAILLLPKISLGFLGTGCDREMGFWNKFTCEQFLLVFALNILAWIVVFAFAIYVMIFFIRKNNGKRTNFLNKKIFYLTLGIIITLAVIFYLTLGI